MIVGTAGHIDHGKTALVRALTGVDTDRLKEEKARGISIDLGFAYLPTADGVLGFVDVPGHEKFIRNMLAGATGIDFALLVVAADDGIMPQTIEHLAIIDLLGIARGLVALTKVDLVSPARREAVEQEIASRLKETGLAGAEIVPVSTVTGEGIEQLRTRLAAAAREPATPSGGLFRLAVDRCFTLAGAGTVVTGTVLSGEVAVGDTVRVSPPDLAARVRSIHAQNRRAERGRAGERCALNLAGDRISKDAIQRGDMIVHPALHAPADRIDATLRVLPTEAKPIGQWLPVRLHHAAAEVGARLVLLQEEPIAPGGAGRVQLVLDHPVAAAAGDRFIVRDTSAQRTIGGGKFLDLRAPARRRRTPDRLRQLDAHALADPGAALQALLACPPHAVDLAAFARDRAIAAGDIDPVLAQTGIVRLPAKNADWALSAATLARMREAIRSVLERFHTDSPDARGIGEERLRVQIEPRLPRAPFSAMIQLLARKASVVIEGTLIRLPGQTLKLNPRDEKLWAKVAPLLSGAERFRPPRVADIAAVVAPAAEVRQLLKSLARMGQVVEVAPDHFFLRRTVGEMVAIAAALAAAAPDAQFTAAQFRDRLDNGRKVAIQILEFFDRHGVTLRRGDLRRMNRQKLDAFGAPDAPDGGPSPAPAAPKTAVALPPRQGRESSPVGRPDFKSGRGR